MSLTEILEEVAKLTPHERNQVAKALDAPTDIPDCKDADMRKRQNELNERLAAEGVLRRPPDPNRKPRKFSPARIKGKPLSETIIEERR